MSIYIITNVSKEKKNIYKIGKSRKSQNGIINNYTQYMLNPEIKFFIKIPQFKDIINIILYELREYNIKTKFNKLSNWVKLDLYEILQVIHFIIDETSCQFDTFLSDFEENDSIYKKSLDIKLEYEKTEQIVFSGKKYENKHITIEN